MTSRVRGGLIRYTLAGALWRLAVIAALAWVSWRMEHAAKTATPRLDDQPAALREALRFPWQGFPPVSDAERKELDSLIPLDPAIRISDIRPWTTAPADPALGGRAVSANAALAEAFGIIERIRDHRLNRTDPSFNEAEQIAETKRRLTAAQETATPAMAWLIHYDRGVVYGWENNRQRAAREFESAWARLKPHVESAAVSDEARLAAIHVLYAWGDASIDPANTKNEQAIDALRGAVIQVTNRFRARNPATVAPAAEFHELAPTGLSTRALRNDLLAAYLGSPDYTFCTAPLPASLCDPSAFAGPCKYRNERFCKTVGRKPLQGVFEAERDSFAKGKSREAMVWALQNAVELEAENPLHDEPIVAYNVAKLLHDLKRPDLAYRYMQPIVTSASGEGIEPAMVRLAWVSSILANEKVGAMALPQSKSQPSGYRLAYESLHPPSANDEPVPFQPLQLENAEKGKSLDAWLFIRRYRYLLDRGELDRFIDEHRRLKAHGGVSMDFLDEWKKAVVVDFLKRTAVRRESAHPATKAVIDRYLSRSDLFTREELKAAGLGRPFDWSMFRWLWHALVAAIAFLLLRDFAWRYRAYRSTFESAYQRDRRARAGR